MGSERHSKKTESFQFVFSTKFMDCHHCYTTISQKTVHLWKIIYCTWDGFEEHASSCMTWPKKSQRVTCGRDSEIPSKERKEITEWAREVCYTRLPGQDTTVSVTLFFCSLSIGMREELFIPTVVAPFTATISSPHLRKPRDIFVIRVGAEKMQERMM